ncbi:histone H2A.v2 isoform X3 [Eurytemora carolleeae]|uniref:histone H2A.v2 isoform X3 n=1 Tax=Eurytemora carolleeae TaxID=1294199 RepID=UPI000C78B039|nr:histone H2A.v2 isoform X3 [Eurytemora carolleeae]|eukprot:XP_023337186.1 histone H2A.v2-like isoform X3 [Eurytemora affinis]
MSSNTELEGDVMEVQAHKGIHKNVEDLLEATEAFNGTDELKDTKEKIEDEIMKDETDENQAVDDKPPSIPCHVTRSVSSVPQNNEIPPTIASLILEDVISTAMSQSPSETCSIDLLQGHAKSNARIPSGRAGLPESGVLRQSCIVLPPTSSLSGILVKTSSNTPSPAKKVGFKLPSQLGACDSPRIGKSEFTPRAVVGSSPESIHQISQFIQKTQISNQVDESRTELVKRKLFDANTEPQLDIIRFAKKKRVGKSAKAGIVFPVTRMISKLKKGRYARHIGVGAGVYMAAVLEYLVAEILELSGNFTRYHNRARITPRSILLTLKHDSELDELTRTVTIPQGGVRPCIHPSLLPADSST